MSYPKTGEEVYVSLNLSNTMLTGIGKGTITREEVSADYLKRLFARYGVIVSAKPEQRRLLELVNDNFDLGLEIPETLKLFQLSEQHRRLVVINVQGLRRKNGSLLPEYTEEEFNEATFIFVKYYIQAATMTSWWRKTRSCSLSWTRRLNGATAPITAEKNAYNPAPAGQNKVRLCGLTFIFCKEDLRYEQELYQRRVQLHPQYVHQVLRDQLRPSLPGYGQLRPVQHPGGYPRESPLHGPVHRLPELPQDLTQSP